MSTKSILDSLTYACYKQNRELSPSVKPEDWQPCFDAPVAPMEERYQTEMGQRMKDLLERMDARLNGVSPASKQFEVDREKEAMNPRVLYES